ncbi:AsmA-like C-terminal region-containing protein [Tundrisphaera lichenicola]|uniref:hypothetical protein n=1 Tax=Tundrisphaera lichenicola TaxID=2029860 RepID=UPI003EC11D21
MISEFAASLEGKPLKANGDLEISAPYRFDARLDAHGWKIDKILALIPNLPGPAPAFGELEVQGHVAGTILPFAISTEGAARIANVVVKQVPLGVLVFQWRTDRDLLSIIGLESFCFGGRISGEGSVPIRSGGEIVASLNLKGIESSRLSALLKPGSVALDGRVDGSLKFSVPSDRTVVSADAMLVAPDLIIREGTSNGIPVRSLHVTAKLANHILEYKATADSLGASVRFNGSAPVLDDLSEIVAEAQVQAAGFRLNEAWQGMGISGGLGELDGLGAIDANLRGSIQPSRLWSRGIFELRNLRYGQNLDLGGLRGTFSLSPTTWRLEELTGDLLGGLTSGEARGVSIAGAPKDINFDFRITRASIARMLAAFPALSRNAQGFGTLRASGRLAEELRATAELQVPRAQVLGLSVSDLRFPADLQLNPTSGVGVINSRRWMTRVGGGSIQGNVMLRLGPNRSFRSETQLNGLDLEVLSRLRTNGKQNIRGKVSGKIDLNGTDTTQLDWSRGMVALDLSDASLVELPVFKELDRFLGASRGGGLFEEGHIQATIANRSLYIDSMTLQGPVVQIHSNGTVTFLGGLDLEVLVNTNEIIPESGLALVALVPGLGQALGRGQEVLFRLATFLQNRLLKFRVTGTLDNPTVRLDAGIAVTQGAAGFFAGVFKLPGSSSR